MVGKEYIAFDFAAFMVKVTLCLVHLCFVKWWIALSVISDFLFFIFCGQKEISLN